MKNTAIDRARRSGSTADGNETRTPAAEAFTKLVFEIFRLNGRIIAAGERLTAGLDITTARWQVLGAVFGRRAPLTVAQIGRRLGLQRQSVQRIVDLLAAEGMLEFLPNPDHSRAKLVNLTAAGLTKLKHLRRRQCVWSNRIASGLSPKEIASTRALLKRLSDRLENDVTQ